MKEDMGKRSGVENCTRVAKMLRYWREIQNKLDYIISVDFLLLECFALSRHQTVDCSCNNITELIQTSLSLEYLFQIQLSF